MQWRTSILINNDAVIDDARRQFLKEGQLDLQVVTPTQSLSAYHLVSQFLRRLLTRDMRVAAVVGESESARLPSDSLHQEYTGLDNQWGPKESIVILRLEGAAPDFSVLGAVRCAVIRLVARGGRQESESQSYQTADLVTLVTQHGTPPQQEPASDTATSYQFAILELSCARDESIQSRFVRRDPESTGVPKPKGLGQARSRVRRS